MASMHISAMRHIGRCALRQNRTITQQRRWAQVQDVRFLVTTQPPQAIVEKYYAKLDQKAKTEGFGSIEKLKVAYADKIGEVQRSGAVDFPIPKAPDTPVKQPYRGELDIEIEGVTEGESEEGGEIPQAPGIPVKQPYKGDKPPFEDAPLQGYIPQAPETPVKQPNKDTTASAARRAASSEKPAIKGLDDIIDLDKARHLPEKELTAIWRLRHASSDSNLCAVMPAAAYLAMEEAARTSPQFVLPVPHQDQGAEIHFLQWTFDAESKTSTVLFTQLAEYKTRGEFAQPHTTITHHLDLVDEKGLVLMQGQTVDHTKIKPEQAKWLVVSLQLFYGGWESGEAELTGERKQRAEERKKLLEFFAMGDSRFSVEKLMEEAERMG